MKIDISIIIPVLNEMHIINQTLDSLRELRAKGSYEIIVADGDKDGSTLKAITQKGIIKIKSACGRGVQMNTGARAARGRTLLFLHADTILPEKATELIISACRSKSISGGAFDLEIDSGRLIFRLIEKIASARSRLTRIPYGDQAIFIDKKKFFDNGAYSDISVMEDIDLMQRMKKAGRKICFIHKPVKTSARRWEKEGVFYCTIRNNILSTLFYLGVSPHLLKKYYR